MLFCMHAIVSERVGSLIPASQQKTLPTFRPDALVFFRAKKRASGPNIGKVFNPVVKLVLENQPFLKPEPAEKPSYPAIVDFT